MLKFIIITGGVISGLGKGIVTSSIGKLLQARGFKIQICKIDPYLNIDAGTMRPTVHGEVWVTYDGGETDQDLGHYERFLNRELSKQNNITTGQVYLQVIQNERSGKYLGSDVEIFPHVSEEIKRRIKNVAKDDTDFILVEIGGTAGDYQNIPFLQACRLLKYEEDLPVIFVHVVYVPIPAHLGEAKTKPVQQSVRFLWEMGVAPDMIVCRSERPVDDVRKKKISTFCNISSKNIFSSHDVKSVYKVPLLLEEQGMTSQIFEKFNIENGKPDLDLWNSLIEKINSPKKKVKIGLVAKYFKTGAFLLPDSYVSVVESVKHAATHLSIEPEIVWFDALEIEKKPELLSEVDGVIVPGGFGSTGIEGKIRAAKYARENNIPYLGLCLGLQVAVIDFARNVCGLKANSSEFDVGAEHSVIDILPEQRELLKNNDYGSSMRLGNYPTVIKKGSKLFEIYGESIILRRHRHRYEVNPKYHVLLQENGLVFSGISPDEKLVEFIELPEHKFFFATQAHPEFSSSFEKPEPLFLNFVKSCT
ncbi:MAG: CTP synthase [Nanoarchaeota archaeon]|nr:CTP synthase [Nanoarchaeota archaeon]